MLKNDILSKLNIAYVINHSLLIGGYFRFVTLQHEVWIDTGGIVRAITYPDEITLENAKRFINNTALQIPEKIPPKSENNSFIHRSILERYKPGSTNIIGTLTPAYLKRQNCEQIFCYLIC